MLLHRPSGRRFLRRHVPRIAGFAFAVCVACSLSRGQTVDGAFSPQANAAVYAVATQPDGKVLIGGNFTTIGSSTRNRLARLNADGSVDMTFNPSVSSTVLAISIQPDGKIVIGGIFTAVRGQPIARLARLMPDGQLDSTFSPRIDDGVVHTIASLPDGRMLVGGRFTTIGGVPRVGLARLGADGVLDASFDVGMRGVISGTETLVEGISLLPGGGVLIVGDFNTVAGQSRTGVARLTANGILDPGFRPPTLFGLPRGALPLDDGRCLVVGAYIRVSSSTFQRLLRLNADGSLDQSFAPPIFDLDANSVVRQADGKLVLGGAFTRVGGVMRHGVVRLNADGSLDPSLGTEFAGVLDEASVPSVYKLSLGPGSLNILAVGAFTSVAGQPHSGVVRFGSPLPSFIRQPTHVNAQAGATIALSVASEATDLRYQWYRNGVPVPGATTATLTLADFQAVAAGGYTVTATNPWGSATSASAVVAVGGPVAPSFTFATFAGVAGQTGRVDGTGGAARFDHPTGLAMDAAGNAYVLDSGSNFLRRITPSGVVTTVSSQAGIGLAIDAAGYIYVADGVSRIVRVASSGMGEVFAGTATPGSANGPASSAQFRAPTGVAVNAAGVVYVADTGNFTIRRISLSGAVDTLAGTLGMSGSTDGVGAAARFIGPSGLALDAAGNIYVADRDRVRRVTPSGGVSTLAEVGAIAVAVDAAGMVYASDPLGHVIRRIAPDGTVVVVAGAVGAPGVSDGLGTTARFVSPWGMAFDRSGSLHVADNGNGTIRRALAEPVPLAIQVRPQTTHAEAGVAVALGVGAHGASPSYQWKKDGVPIVGATGATLLLASPTAAGNMGYYSVLVGSAGSQVESEAVLLTVSNPASPGRLINVATRGLVRADGALTPGFVLRGTGEKRLIVRAVGPTLLRFGVGGVLANPRLELAPLGGAVMSTNDDWAPGDGALAAATAAAGGFPLDAGSKDAAVMVSLPGGGAYTMNVMGSDDGASGLALAEVYEASPSGSGSQIVNVSTLGFVGVGGNALVPGFVIGGGGPLRLVIRAVGPGLEAFGVKDALMDPHLSVVPLGRTTPVATNDNWGGDVALSAAFATAGAFNLAPGSKDSAVLLRLPPGAYTVVVSGVGGATGTALVEIYDVP